MPSVSQSVGNLTQSVGEILGGLLDSILAVFQSIFALATNTIGAFFGILRLLFTRVVDLIVGAGGFIVGASTLRKLFSFATRGLFVVYLQVTSSSSLFLELRTGSSRRRRSEDGRPIESSG
jgi:type IV secretory pathway VirB2 component (pilin)